MRPRVAQTVTVVANQTPPDVLQTILDVGDYDIVHIASVERAYSHIKRTAPNLVILCLEGDEEGACQVLSMLKTDHSTSHIPVLTCMPTRSAGQAADRFGDDPARQPVALTAQA